MQVRLTHDAPGGVHAGALVVPFFSNDALDGTAKEIDAALGGGIADALASKEIQGRLGEHVLLYAKNEPYRRVLAISLGERSRFEPSALARYAGVAVRYLGRRNVEQIAIALPPQAEGNEAVYASFVAEGALAGAFETTLYQEKPDRRIATGEVTILAGGLNEAEVQRGIARGTALGEAVNLARRLALTPANDMTPTRLAEEAEKVAGQYGLQIEVLDEERARREGMGSFLSVAAGSVQPPKFIVIRYNGDPSSKELLALVGKGITFDTGGISIKPAERMEDMKYDMSGGAGVIAAMSAIGRLKPKLNIVGIVPATENMPGGKATKPGDVVTAMNGKTIEVINTDAEGRLILADALCYANKLGATKIVDAATLTGACVIALGHASSAAVTNNDAFGAEFLAAAKPTGERPAGTLTAAAFLREFVGTTPWIHLDIAGTAYLENESAWQAKGPTGTPVRAMLALVESLASGDDKAKSSSNGARSEELTV
jgi:leucyl aminopeptidase